jgi:hypothetical protein
MPPTEPNNKTARYREHRIMLTKWSNSTALAPRYAFLSELIMLWLDSSQDKEEKVWSLLASYMSPKRTGLLSTSYDNRDQADLIDSPVNDTAKAQMKEYLEDFLRDEGSD